jgi:hypothetical protein
MTGAAAEASSVSMKIWRRVRLVAIVVCWIGRLNGQTPWRTGGHVNVINFASAAPSKIRERAELGLYLQLTAAGVRSSPSDARCGPLC